MSEHPSPLLVTQVQPFLIPPATWIMCLNRYQRDNLLDLLEAIMGGDGKDLSAYKFNNGDWVGELRWMLGKQYYDSDKHEIVKSFQISGRDNPNRRPAYTRQIAEDGS